MTRHQEVYNEDCALYVPCSQVQLARVVVRVLVLVDVICVMLVVLIAHVDVVRAVETVFVAIFCSWRCTLYKKTAHEEPVRRCTRSCGVNFTTAPDSFRI